MSEGQPRHNLPTKPRTPLVGREAVLNEIRTRIADTTGDWFIPIVGGYGRRTVSETGFTRAERLRRNVALTAAWDYVEPNETRLEAEKYDAVLWVNIPKYEEYVPGNRRPPKPQVTIEQATYDAARQLLVRENNFDEPLTSEDFRKLSLEDQRRVTFEMLRTIGPRVLLIYDNHDSDVDTSFLRNFPKSMKAILATMLSIDLPLPIILNP